ncbi:single-stranded-DNA-specific exonuclease RecJ [uncultured Ferrovibrio sp.]|jgi:single-stranded-DNA-specific exonuclease RecJ|uniref:single-stranded-DNA-specific exonuclease RecJ n=1 Tax=uncultured Ferrovibrio sp. TaxID=1576913 RepID=UPI00261C6F7C|nr:single-stranded-DNA-specific exonuclease RecJ [uncultured Ferrovibrio sp.]
MLGGDSSPFLGVTRSVQGRRWRLRNMDDRLALAIAQQAGLPEILGRVLAGRGVDLDLLEDHLNPSLRRMLPDPSRFRDMDAAADRIAHAIEMGEKVAVFGDYDVDGATSTALLNRFFRAIGRDLRVYIPDRLKEGYGPNTPALRKLAAEGVKLVITVDCGTLAFAPLEDAASIGLEVVVVDHHLAEPELPKALAVINPNRLDEAQGYGQLAAVGVAFLLVVAVNRRLRERGFYSASRPVPDLLQWLDLVALGTVCDVVPLTGLNRALVTQGIKVLRSRGNVGLAALADVAGINEPPGAYHLGFLLGPRVNAGGRVGQADLGTRLLSCDDPREAQAIAAELDRYNRERQEIEAVVLAEAMQEFEHLPEDVPLALVARQGWHPGVIGIVAARIREAAGRPSFVIALDANGIGKGSGRSIPGVDLGAAVVAASQAGLLINGGGHAMAAGLTVEAAKLNELKAFLNERLAGPVAKAGASASLGFDGVIGVGGCNADLCDKLEQLGPYGSGNPEPRFALASARVVQADVVGEKHVRCLITAGDGQGARLRAIAFRSLDGDLGPALLQARQTGSALHIGGHLRSSYWRGERQIQFVLEDAALPAA